MTRNVSIMLPCEGACIPQMGKVCNHTDILLGTWHCPGSSPVVAPLRVVTTCYTRVQQNLLDRGVSAPKAPRRIVVGCSEPRSTGCLLRRTSENTPYRQL